MPESKFVAVQYQDSEGNWRVKLSEARTGIREARRQGVYLSELAKHGRVRDAAYVAGVSRQTVRQLRDTDSDFDEACVEAMQTYADRVVAHHQKLLFEGQERVTYDRQGKIQSTEVIYPIRLIELELKKHDEGYRDKREVDLKVSGGVLIAPADAPTIDDWEARFAAATDVTPRAEEGEPPVKEPGGQE